MDLSVLALALRGTAALVDLAGHTVTGVLEQWADRVDPPGLDYAGLDVRLDGLTPLEMAQGRVARAEAGAEAALRDWRAAQQKATFRYRGSEHDAYP